MYENRQTLRMYLKVHPERTPAIEKQTNQVMDDSHMLIPDFDYMTRLSDDNSLSELKTVTKCKRKQITNSANNNFPKLPKLTSVTDLNHKIFNKFSEPNSNVNLRNKNVPNSSQTYLKLVKCVKPYKHDS